MNPFQDRREAGRALAQLLEPYRALKPTILALPRGGVPVAYEIARAMDAPLDVFVVRKLGVPDNEELAMGAVASGGAVVINDEIVDQLGITHDEMKRTVAAETREIERRETAYRGGHSAAPIRDRTVIVVDDGMATGASMRVALHALRMLSPKQIVVAVPVASREALSMARNHAEDWACVHVPERFFAVGVWYRNFDQVTDGEVRDLLARAEGATYSA